MINIKKGIAATTCFFYLYASSLPAWGDAITSSAASGNQTAQQAISNFSAPTLQNNKIIFSSGGQSSDIDLKDIFPGASSAVAPDLEHAYGYDDRTLERGSAANARLATEDSMDGEAYRVLKGTAGLIRPNIKNDPLWGNTDSVLANQDVFESEFADCSKNTEVKEVKLTKHVPDYKTCERINKPSGNCDINHYVEIEPEPTDLFFLVDNSASMESVIAALRENVYRVAELLGAKNKDQLRIGGAVTRGDQYLSNHIKLTYDIDAFQSWINSVSINRGPTYTFPAVNWAAANNDWRDGVNRVLVVIGNQDNGGGPSPAATISAMDFQVYIFHDNVQIKSIGVPMANNFTAGGLFRVAQFLTVVRDRWEPAACIQAAKSTLDGFCNGTYTVTSGGTPCVNLSGFDVCPGDPIYNKLTAPPIPNVDKLAVKVAVGDVQCPFNEGQMECYTDANGNQQCPQNEEGACTVTHPMSVAEVPLVAKVAVEDVSGSGESNRVRITFTDGQAVNTSRSAGFDSAIQALPISYICKRDGNGKILPHKFAFGSASIWEGHSFAPNTLAGANLSVVQMPSCENNLTAVVDIRDVGAGTPGKYYSQEINFKIVRLENESWGPPNCLQSAQKVAGGTCSEGGTVTVTKGGNGGCIPIKGVQVCPGDPFYEAMKPSPIPGIDKLAMAVKVNGCVTDGLRASTCEKLESTQGCGFISTKCVGNATGASGYCYVQEEVWDCGVDVPVNSAELNSSYQCDGPVRCLGTECYNPVDEKSSDFAYAAASLQIAQFAEHDLDCGDPNAGNLDCRIWKGEHYECKKAVGGWVDCCESPDNVSIFDYMNLTWNTLKAANYMGAFGQAAQEQGLFSYGADLVAQGWNTVVKSAFSSASDTLKAEVTKTGLMQGFKQELMNAVAEWTYEVFGEAAASALFSSAGTGGASTATPYVPGVDAAFSSAVAGALSVIMIAYTIYTITNILVQIIWECEEKEFELGAKKATKVCHFVGSYCADETPFGCIEKRESYCCFNSPLGRIIQEQARPQLGTPFGDPENPDCSGLKVDDLGKLDWSKIDISEWVGIMNLTGHYPTIGDIDLEKLTGKTSTLSLDGNRPNTLDRNVKRLEGLGDFPDQRKQLEDAIRSDL